MSGPHQASGIRFLQEGSLEWATAWLLKSNISMETKDIHNHVLALIWCSDLLGLFQSENDWLRFID